MVSQNGRSDNGRNANAPPRSNVSGPKRRKRQKRKEELIRQIGQVRDPSSSKKRTSLFSSKVRPTQETLSALEDELLHIEVEEMREHILACPNVPGDSRALLVALGGLDDALAGANGRDSNGNTAGSMPPQSKDRSIDMSSDSSQSSGDESDENVETKRRKPLGRIYRVLLMDFPLILALVALLTAHSLRHMYDTYYDPLIESLKWDDNDKTRLIDESTYYLRDCSQQDVTTTNAMDIVIGPNYTAEEAFDIQMRHGVAAVPHVVKDHNARAMRDWALKRNAELTDVDSIPLIAQNHRWSFRISGSDHPSVSPVLHDIATHPVLRRLIHDVIGDQAALVELTTITSAYGAVDQHWHKDNDADLSQTGAARSFAPMYSIFIPLQDTTPSMGATDMVAGTRFCDGKTGELGRTHGVRMTSSRGIWGRPEDKGVWKSGDALLMDLVSHHRGPGHSDPHGEERVMLIMTLSPRPQTPHIDRRQLALGTSYSNGWDNWALTMDDLINTNETMAQPWNMLRTLGLYKRPGDGAWGWDLFTMVSSQIANDGMGYRYENLVENIPRLVRAFGPFLGEFIFNQDVEDYMDTGWKDFISECLDRSIYLLSRVYGVALGTYVVAVFSGVVLGWAGFRTSIRRLIYINALVLLFFYILIFVHVYEKPWAVDIRSGEVTNPPFTGEDLIIDSLGTTFLPHYGPTTLPELADVLIGTRYDAPFLGGHNRFLDFHPGNQRWLEDVSRMAPLVTQYEGGGGGNENTGRLPPAFLARAVLGILEDVESRGGRFLLQDPDGDWLLLDLEDAVLYTRRALLDANNALIKALAQTNAIQISECRHGLQRRTALSKRHTPALLHKWRRRIYLELTEHQEQQQPSSKPLIAGFDEISSSSMTSLLDMPLGLPKLEPYFLTPNDLNSRSTTKFRNKMMIDFLNELPIMDEFIVGDRIQAHFDDGWYRGFVSATHSDGDNELVSVDIYFDDNDVEEDFPVSRVRHSVPMVEGDAVVSEFQGTMFRGHIRRVTSRNTYDILFEDGDFRTGWEPEQFRRIVDMGGNS